MAVNVIQHHLTEHT